MADMYFIALGRWLSYRVLDSRRRARRSPESNGARSPWLAPRGRRDHEGRT